MNNTPLRQQFLQTRENFLQACAPLVPDDYCLQAEAFTSPPKWHLAHTSWFFETFLLKPFMAGYQSPNDHYVVLFNSYYNAVGEQYPRPKRGLLSRPTIAEVMTYRKHVDNAMLDLLADQNHAQRDAILSRCRLGIEHEKQHQELFFTDLKYSLAVNPLFPRYREATPATVTSAEPITWHDFDAGLIDIGAPDKHSAFTFDNECPQHRVYLRPFSLADRLVTNREYQDFINDAGYRRPELWLADGWATVQEQGWRHPLYWRQLDGTAMEYTPYGLLSRDPDQPVCHISAYEADAYARWAGARLPLEPEWEHAASLQGMDEQADCHDALHPQTARHCDKLSQLYSDCWQWTGSAYRPYPGYAPTDDAIGEYNGKFMSNQWVLRGGSSVSPRQHLRPSYRNFFYPQDRWQFSGLRLARDW